MYRNLLIAVASVATLTAVFAVGTGAAPTNSAVVILRNGNYVTGQVTNLGDRYQIHMSSGGKVQISKKRVEFVAKSLDDAYLRKRDQLPQNSLKARIALAQWCLTVRLYDRAADQVLAVWRIDPRSRQLRALEQRLAAVARKRKAIEHVANAAQKAAAKQRKKRYTVAPLPPGAVQQFTLTIQPILLNRCSQSSCHGSSSTSKFRLIRPARGYLLKRRATQRNLQAALRWVDRENPSASPLIQLPSAPHGTAKTSVFEGKFEVVQRKRLLDWIQTLVTSQKDKTKTAAPTAIKKKKSTLSQPDVDSEAEFQAPIGKEKFVPKDPFDPQIFNRKFFPPEKDRAKDAKK